MKSPLCLFCWIMLYTPLIAKMRSPGLNFDYQGPARQAYEAIMALRLEAATAQLAQLRRSQPHNLAIDHLENYLDFFVLYIGENPTAYEQRRKNLERRLLRLQQGDPRSPYTLYAQADCRLQWTMLRLRFGDYWAAFNEASKAHKLLQKNQALFPDFLPNYKDLGLLHAVVGTIPDNYRWGIRLLGGLRGTIAQGRGEIEKVLQYARHHDFLFTVETIYFYAFLLLHLDNAPEKAWQTLQQSGLQPQKNPLHCFVLANVAMRSGKNDEAIRLLSARPRQESFYPFPYLDFMLGMAKLRRLDYGAAADLQAFLQQFQGRNYIKEAYQKLAWCALLQGRPSEYRRLMDRCAQQGKAEIGADKHAQEEASVGPAPDPTLLKARLRFDGGYYREALALLLPHPENTWTTPVNRLEYVYRLGRIYHGLEQYPQAIAFYQKTIERGAADGHYFACNAALQLGLVYEHLGQKEAARRAFQRCLQIKPKDYRSSLHQAAKAGLDRLR